MDLKGRDLGWAAIGMKMKRVDLTIRYWWRKFKASHKVKKERKKEERKVMGVFFFSFFSLVDSVQPERGWCIA